MAEDDADAQRSNLRYRTSDEATARANDGLQHDIDNPRPLDDRANNQHPNPNLRKSTNDRDVIF